MPLQDESVVSSIHNSIAPQKLFAQEHLARMRILRNVELGKDEPRVKKITDLVDAVLNSHGKFLVYIITILSSSLPRAFLCC